ncbi:ABC transporter substrate-binding protein [Maridesulfovibrio sp. FT414]|uniref:ABC transporter substrate-binding protein n=1 Tax=Maridesulfovibrio sp. FT414 TaxID=2979469 RepID=UPI003D80A3C8
MSIMHQWPLWSTLKLVFRRCFFLLAAGSLIALSHPAYAGIVIEDDFGQRVELNEPARRIVALYGSFNEILCSMDLGDRLVARTSADHYPESVVSLPSIGTHMRPNPELIVAMKPDLVLQMAGRSQATSALEPLRKQGIPCAMFQVTSFEELFSVIDRLGILTAEQGRAIDLVSSMKSRLARAAAKHAGNSHSPSVFFEVRYPNLLAAGQESIVADIIARAGGRNCVESDKKIVRIGEEELFRLAPDIYVYQVGRMNPSPVLPSERPHFKGLEAVKNDNTLQVDESVFSRPGPRNVDAVEILADFLFSDKEK